MLLQEYKQLLGVITKEKRFNSFWIKKLLKEMREN